MLQRLVPGTITMVHLFTSGNRNREYGIALEYIERKWGLRRVYTASMTEEDAQTLTQMMLAAIPGQVRYYQDGWVWYIGEVQ